jgi:hypothetical protein
MALIHHNTADCGCEDCRPHPLARNNYFTGKLMCERDFTDEQWFFREKIRLHHQRLHGTGVVCGLEIRQHPNAACRDRLVLLEPGSAIDCCGHDILVTEQDVFDFTQTPAVKAIKDSGAHVLEFCLVWRECPSEDVPILYDECGCDDSQSAPNRILESYALEVRVDPKITPKSHGQTFDWGPSIGIAKADAALLDETGQRVFVLADTATIYQVDTIHLLVESSLSASGAVLGMALAPGGGTLYAALASATGPQIQALSAGATGLAASGAAITLETGTDAVSLTAGAPGLFAVDTTTGAYWFFAAPVALTAPAAPAGTLGASSAAVFSSDGTTAWLGVPGAASLNSITLATLASSTITLSSATVTVGAADAIALVPQGAGADRLAILDKSGSLLHLFDIGSGKIIASTSLAGTPLALIVSADGGTAIISTENTIQAVNLVTLAAGATDAAGATYPLEAAIGPAAITADATRLYVPFTGAGAVNQGGVAVVYISGHNCRDALLGGHCPHCDTPDCLVLARVTGWHAGDALTDMPRPPAAAPAGLAYIDNTARTVLASTQAITKALLCLMDQPPAAAPVVTPPTPAPPVPVTFTHVSAISWKHAAPIAHFLDQKPSLALAFDGPVTAAQLSQPGALIFLLAHNQLLAKGAKAALHCWCAITPVSYDYATISPAGKIPPAGSPDWQLKPAKPPAFCTAIRANFDIETLRLAWVGAAEAEDDLVLRVLLNGDLVADKAGRGLDANHLPPWLPGRITGDGIEGGGFESWLGIPRPKLEQPAPGDTSGYQVGIPEGQKPLTLPPDTQLDPAPGQGTITSASHISS